MIIKNRRTNEKLELSYEEFRQKFKKEIEVSFQSFKKTELAKTFFNYPDDNMLESNFYFSLRFNFNSFGNSAWYIDKI
ncbi:MAG: hypothetical protein R3Y28_06890 [Candidatus Gastranaerophilales bacterium]